MLSSPTSEQRAPSSVPDDNLKKEQADISKKLQNADENAPPSSPTTSTSGTRFESLMQEARHLLQESPLNIGGKRASAPSEPVEEESSLSSLRARLAALSSATTSTSTNKNGFTVHPMPSSKLSSNTYNARIIDSSDDDDEGVDKQEAEEIRRLRSKYTSLSARTAPTTDSVNDLKARLEATRELLKRSLTSTNEATPERPNPMLPSLALSSSPAAMVEDARGRSVFRVSRIVDPASKESTTTSQELIAESAKAREELRQVMEDATATLLKSQHPQTASKNPVSFRTRLGWAVGMFALFCLVLAVVLAPWPCSQCQGNGSCACGCSSNNNDPAAVLEWSVVELLEASARWVQARLDRPPF